MISNIDIEDMTDAQDEALLPCPFCGGKAEVIHIGNGPNEGGSCVSCANCLASSNLEFGFKENFRNNWNSRADLARPSQAGDERVARLREGVERLHKTVVGAWDRAGTLPAKASVKVVPSDWHDLRNQIEVLVAALAAMDTPKGGGDAD